MLMSKEREAEKALPNGGVQEPRVRSCYGSFGGRVSMT